MFTGRLVSGHVDRVGKLVTRGALLGGALRLGFEVPEALSALIWGVPPWTVPAAGPGSRWLPLMRAGFLR